MKREVPRKDTFEDWPGETCYRCGNRVNAGFIVDDDIWMSVVGDETIVWCPLCFDLEAQSKNIKYTFKDNCLLSWSDWIEIDEKENFK